MKEQLKDLVERAKQEANLIKNENDFLNIKSKYLGKKSELANYMSEIKNMSVEDKKEYGPLFNKIKKEFEELFTTKLEEASNSKEVLTFDPTIPCKCKHGSLHPVTLVGREVSNILKNMGFMVLSGPEMETEYYNFEALNVPKTHPARDMQDTFWLENGQLLKTQTSAAQNKIMKKYGAPLKAIFPGRCFRNEALDASHENTFFQMEGMMIDKNVSISNLIYFMKAILSEIFKKEVEVRLRPGFFPFVEPGFELDVKCPYCDGVGCKVCKNGGWIELCPCGMIHPNVLKMGGINPEEYSGFAFGLGLSRLAMMKFEIDDLRLLNSGDLRVLKQLNIK